MNISIALVAQRKKEVSLLFYPLVNVFLLVQKLVSFCNVWAFYERKTENIIGQKVLGRKNILAIKDIDFVF